MPKAGVEIEAGEVVDADRGDDVAEADHAGAGQSCRGMRPATAIMNIITKPAGESTMPARSAV